MNEKISILITGGTIDSYFDPITESVLTNQEDAIGKYLDLMQLHLDYSINPICQKDSRDITKEDRENILSFIQKSQNKFFLVTHGTFTMADTARFIKKNEKELSDKTIVFTGSMKPLKGFQDSDAMFNLGFALASLLLLKPGIYVSMNGENFNPEEVYKNITKGRFEIFK